MQNKIVEPQVVSQITLRDVRGVVEFLPMTEPAVELRMPSAGSATNEGTSKLCVDQWPRWDLISL